jgi:hypothetical protein
MNSTIRSLCAVLAAATIAVGPATAQDAARGASRVSADEAREIAIEAYVYAYPLLISEITRRVFLAPGPDGSAMNRFVHLTAFPDPTFTAVVRPNADTLYSTLWYDVTKEPLVIGVPDSGGRYYLLPMLDFWSDVFASPGTRTTGNGAQTIVLASADWHGTVPSGAMLIRAPTPLGFIIGRTQTNGASDYANVHKFQSALTATPLSQLGKPYTAPRLVLDPGWDLKTPPPDQIDKMSAAQYFALFAELARSNPPHANDYPILQRMARIGLEVGKPFSLTAVPAELRAAFEAAPVAAQRLVKAGLAGGGVQQNGWRTNLSGIGTYGTDYARRAAVAYGGYGANTVDDAMYPSALSDSRGRRFSSDARYAIHFAQGELPPVRAFWSLTLYDDRQLFAANPLNRYAIGDRDSLKKNADGSLDLYIQRDSPGKDKESNWLPAPASGAFTMNLRLYWPRPAARDGTWMPPPVERVE